MCVLSVFYLLISFIGLCAPNEGFVSSSYCDDFDFIRMAGSPFIPLNQFSQQQKLLNSFIFSIVFERIVTHCTLSKTRGHGQIHCTLIGSPQIHRCLPNNNFRSVCLSSFFSSVFSLANELTEEFISFRFSIIELFHLSDFFNEKLNIKLNRN